MKEYQILFHNGQEIDLRPIPVSPNDDYMAGSDGNIYSRTKYKGFGRKQYVDWYPLKGHINSKGYKSISLCHDGKKVTKSVHRLVCMSFHGMPATATLQVRHLDSNPQNNCPNNLAWGTQEENWIDRKIVGHGIEGEKHPLSKLTDIERGHIRWCFEKGICTKKQLARGLGVSVAVIQRVCTTGRPENLEELCKQPVNNGI